MSLFKKIGKVKHLIKKSIYFAWYRHHFIIPPRVLIKYIKSFFLILKKSNYIPNLFDKKNAYIDWLNNQNNIKYYKKFKYNPLISVIIPTYNVSEKFLIECIESVLNQSYENFEICIADDNSSLIDTKKVLSEYENNPKIRIVYRKENGMISKCTNSALELAHGEFIVLLDDDDTIEKNALYYIVETLNKNKKLDFIYTDEDKIDYSGKFIEPHFKPDFSPDTFMCMNYICHLSCIRKKIVDQLGGFRSEYDGSQDYDLFLRIIETTKNIYHIPKVLYHWRQTKYSTSGYSENKSYAYIAGKKALEDSLRRRKILGEVVENPKLSTYLIKYKNNNPLVSIIIPIKDNAKLTKQCIDSIYEKSTYRNFEIILVDNNSVKKETEDLINSYKIHSNFKVIKIDCEFNYSYINNVAVKKSKGEFLLFLNNDTEVIDEDFLEQMIGYAQQDHVGCVGIKLLYKDKKVQHAGVVLGYGGFAGHVYVAESYNETGYFGRLCMPYNYTAVTAACLMISKNKFESVGGFDENLKVALNDVDLNLKILEKGYYNVCLSNVCMYHHESKTRGFDANEEKSRRFLKEKEYIETKWRNKYCEDKYFSKSIF